jgi:hypothetical protein
MTRKFWMAFFACAVLPLAVTNVGYAATLICHKTGQVYPQPCMVTFSDKTRCVVAAQIGESMSASGTSTAITCDFAPATANPPDWECGTGEGYPQLCMVTFIDKTRCVVAAQKGSPNKDTSTAVACDFSHSTPPAAQPAPNSLQTPGPVKLVP